MRKTSTHLLRTFVMALAWAVAWAPIALAIGLLIIDPDNSMDEMWPAIGAYPGFISGAVFGVLLTFSERRRGFNGISLPHVAALGALSGAVVGTVPVFLLTSGPDVSKAIVGTSFIGIVTFLGAASAIASALVLRKSSMRVLRGPSATVA